MLADEGEPVPGIVCETGLVWGPEREALGAARGASVEVGLDVGLDVGLNEALLFGFM